MPSKLPKMSLIFPLEITHKFIHQFFFVPCYLTGLNRALEGTEYTSGHLGSQQRSSFAWHHPSPSSLVGSIDSDGLSQVLKLKYSFIFFQIWSQSILQRQQTGPTEGLREPCGGV